MVGYLGTSLVVLAMSNGTLYTIWGFLLGVVIVLLIMGVLS